MNAIAFNQLQQGFSRKTSKVDYFQLDYSQYSYRLQKQYLFEDFTYNKSIPIAIELKGNDLAIATENGFVSLLNASHLHTKTKFQAHLNVIFDLKWRPHHNHLLTASGDQSMVIWDVRDLCKIYAISHGHNSSIKSVSFYDPNIFASGGRDGYVRVWDLRCDTKHEVHSIADAHKLQLFKGKRERRKTIFQRSNPVSVVTALKFTSDNRLFSAGANDGCIKQWDLRMLGNDDKFNTLRCARRLEYCGKSDKAEGFTSLALDTAQRVYASCSDNRTYAYDYRGNDGKCESEYVKCFEGSKVNNYTKISVLRDDLLISGSKNSAACVWSIRDAVTGALNMPIFKLQHGIEEVSSVTCDPMTYDLYSCDDDITISKWILESKHHSQNIRESVIANYEEQKQKGEAIRLFSHKAVSSPKTPPLTSLNSWLMNTSKQNLSRSAPLLPKNVEQSTSSTCDSELNTTTTQATIESSKVDVKTPPSKRRASSDVCLTSNKKVRSNDENVDKPRSSTSKGRGRKKLFTPNRSILDYFHS